MPEDAVLITSHLKRAAQTADAIIAAGASFTARQVDDALAEQHFGDWHGAAASDLAATLDDAPRHKFWYVAAETSPPGGESFIDVMDRVGPALKRHTADFPGRNIVAVCHGGTIRAALAHAMGIAPDKALAISVENLSMTRIDHMPGEGIGGDWRLVYVNLRPR